MVRERALKVVLVLGACCCGGDEASPTLLVQLRLLRLSLFQEGR